MKPYIAIVLVMLLSINAVQPLHADDTPPVHPMKQWLNQHSNSKKKVAWGAISGGVLGAIAARSRGEDPLKGALAGAAIGGLAGFLIGRSEDRRIADRAAVMRSVNYDPSQGYRAGVMQVACPGSARQGEQVKVRATFFVIGPDQSEKLTVSRFAGIAIPGNLPPEQKYAGVKSVPPDPLPVAEAAGMWNSTFTVEIPPQLPPGTYEIEIMVGNDARHLAESRAVTIAIVA